MNDDLRSLDELFADGIPTSTGGKHFAAEETPVKVAEEKTSHELVIAFGESNTASAESPTEQYEPKEYGLLNETDLSYIGRGMRRSNEPHDEPPAEIPHRKQIEYCAVEERGEIAAFLQKKQTADVLRGIFGLLLTLPLLCLGFSGKLPFALPAFFASPRRFSLVALAFFAAVCAVNALPLARSFRSLFTAHGDPDCFLPFAGTAALVLLLCDVVKPSGSGAFPLLAASFALALVCGAFGRALKVSAVRRSFTVVGGNKQKGVLVPVTDEQKSRDIMGPMLSGGSVVFKPERTDFVTGFLRQTGTADISSHTALVLAFVSLPIAVFASVLTFLRGGDARQSVYAAACVFFSFLPFSAQFVPAVPFARAAKKAGQTSSAILGYRAAEQVNGVGAVVIDSNHLFPDGSLSLDAMRTFSVSRIDDAIIDAASVVCAAGGALSRIFLSVIDNDPSLLRHVDTLLYEDGLGLSAWVNERRVLVGTAELIRGHGVDVPSRDYEARYCSPGQNLVYVSVAGKLTAMFVITYHPRQEIYDVLFELQKEHIGLVILNRDCNITAAMIERLFDFPTKLITVMTPSNEPLLGESMEARCEAGIVYSRGLLGIGRTVLSSLRMVRAASLANVVQVGGILLTAALTVFLSVVGSLADLTLTELLICQGVFGGLTLLAARIRKA